MTALRVGLTGGIACGKSHVLARFAAAGFHTLDLDRVAHDVMAPGGSAYEEVAQAFGPSVFLPDGRVDRKALGARVFADPDARGRLNAIVHPKVRAEEARWARRAGGSGDVLVTDAALLVESGQHLRFDRLVVAHCDEAEQLRRLMARDGIDPASARARMASQMRGEEKRRFAHFELDTSGRPEDTSRAADRLASQLRPLAASRGARVEVALERALGGLLHGPARGPRALDALRLLSSVVAAGGLEMERVARLLEPRPLVPWYHAALGHEPGAGPEALAVPLALWALARGAPDPPFLAAAAFSLARLTHVDSGAIAGACLFALVVQEVVVAGQVPRDLAARLPEWSSLAARWGGAPPSLNLQPVLRAALRHPADVAQAAEACQRDGGDPSLAAALVGAVVGAPATQAPPSVVEALRGLAGLASSLEAS